jgi:hypothetical protein
MPKKPPKSASATDAFGIDLGLRVAERDEGNAGSAIHRARVIAKGGHMAA